MDYVEFMRQCTCSEDDVPSGGWDMCQQCGTTGIQAVFCCNGHECGCMGQPIDFVSCGCGAEPPAWFTQAKAGNTPETASEPRDGVFSAE